MKSPVVLSAGAQAAVAALIMLGMVGGSLIVAYSGFGTSPRHGGSSTFVPAPQAYLLAATMYGMSAIGLLALLSNRKASRTVITLAAVAYAIAAAGLTAVLSPN
ncbi:MAG: hypothetical protein ABI642_07090 [Polaromonas sp.]